MSTRKVYMYVTVAIVFVAVLVAVFVYMSPPAGREAGGGDKVTQEKTITLVAESIKFNASNPTFTVKKGEPVKITIINNDTLVHNFIINEIAGATTSTINPGGRQTITVTFPTAGTYNYQCSIHAGLMDGTITVTD